MTETSSPEADAGGGTDDQIPASFGYGHGRLPLFLKIVWVAFLVLATWYVVNYLLTSLGDELGS